METTNCTIKVGYGKYGYLDKAYSQLIKNKTINDELWEKRLVIYDITINEIINYYSVDCFESIKYRVTDGEDINEVLLDVLNQDNEVILNFKTIIDIISEYRDIDWLKKFYM